jgi:transposase, IS6 family
MRRCCSTPRFGRHRVGDRWHMNETDVKAVGRWVYLYRVVDQYGQVIDVYASTRRDSDVARRFFQRAGKATGVVPVEVVTERAPTYPGIVEALWPAACITSSGTPITGARPITRGCARCAG